MKQVDLQIQLEDENCLPIYATDEAAGADAKASISENIVLAPGQTRLIPTGIRVQIPEGFELQVRPRSGLAYKHGITVLNTPGTIDSDYRGEIGVILINHGPEAFIITPHMRIAQLVLAPVVRANFLREENLATSDRGEGGFGHSGTH